MKRKVRTKMEMQSFNLNVTAAEVEELKGKIFAAMADALERGVSQPYLPVLSIMINEQKESAAYAADWDNEVNSIFDLATSSGREADSKREKVLGPGELEFRGPKQRKVRDDSFGYPVTTAKVRIGTTGDDGIGVPVGLSVTPMYLPNEDVWQSAKRIRTFFKHPDIQRGGLAVVIGDDKHPPRVEPSLYIDIRKTSRYNKIGEEQTSSLQQHFGQKEGELSVDIDVRDSMLLNNKPFMNKLKALETEMPSNSPAATQASAIEAPGIHNG